MSNRFYITLAATFIVTDVCVVAAGGWGSWFYAVLCALWGGLAGFCVAENLYTKGRAW